MSHFLLKLPFSGVFSHRFLFAARGIKEQRMCLGTFSHLRRSLATSTLYAAVCILAERFLLYRETISFKVKNRLYINIETKLFRGSTLSKALLLSLNTRNVCYSFLATCFHRDCFRRHFIYFGIKTAFSR